MAHLEIVILSYNRIDSLRTQFSALQELGYFSSSNVSVAVQDNCSTDGSAAFLAQSHLPGFSTRIWEKNIGYAQSYLRAHELCKADYLWVIGDDSPSVNANTLLDCISSSLANTLYHVFRDSGQSLPVLPLDIFNGRASIDIDISDVLGIDSNVTSILGGFVSGVIWNHSISRHIFSQNRLLLANHLFASNSPQFFFLPLALLAVDKCNTSSLSIRVHAVSIVDAPFGSLVSPWPRKSSRSIFHAVARFLRGFRSFVLFHIRVKSMLANGDNLLVPAAIWVRATYTAASILDSPGRARTLFYCHLYPLSFYFSVFYSPRNYYPAVCLIAAAIRAFFDFRREFNYFYKIDLVVLVFRVISCQRIGARLKPLFYG